MRKLIAPLVVFAVVASAAPAQAKSVTLTARLKGTKEVPGPGDTDGKGSATIKLNAAKGKVCYAITMSGIDGSAAGHIHAGDTKTAGNVIVPLFGTTSSDSTRSGCVKDVDAAVIAGIVSDPRNHYVNVHNTGFPGGAIRGQLKKA